MWYDVGNMHYNVAGPSEGQIRSLTFDDLGSFLFYFNVFLGYSFLAEFEFSNHFNINEAALVPS